MRDEQILFRDYPLALWLVGAFAIVMGFLLHETVTTRVIFILLGIAAVGFEPVLTVMVDPRQRTLTLRYWSLFRRSIKSFALAQIGAVRVKEDSGEGNYRVELLLQSGEVVPLRVWYRPMKWRHERQAGKIESVARSEWD